MQLQDNATNQDLVTLADDRVSTTLQSYPIEKKVLSANMRMREIWTWIFDAYGGWQYDDANNSDLPEATATLTLNQSFYAFPTSANAIVGISVKNNANSNWYRLTPLTLETIQSRAGSEADFLTVSSQPAYYRPVADGFKIYPASNYTQASSIKVYVDRGISAFTTTDTTKEPGFDSLFHEGVAIGMALDYAKKNSLDVLKNLQREWDGDEDTTGREGGFKRRVKKHYSARFQQMFPPRMTVRDAVREYQ